MLRSVKGEVDAVVLDLGGVIVNLDYGRSLNAFQALIPDLDPETFCGKEHQLPFYSNYELGKISSEEFYFSLTQYYGVKIDFDTFCQSWNAMILDLPENRWKRVSRLSESTRLFLFSNINALHERRLYEVHQEVSASPFHSVFERVYFSHQFGMRKPDPKSFQRILDENQLDPSRTLFIDDSKHHVEGACSVGIRGYHLKPGQTLEELLDELGL
jgi:putative hydrolase of the HAD superfamily